jgi:hypothetical protein
MISKPCIGIKKQLRKKIQAHNIAHFFVFSCLVLSQLKSTQRFFSPCIATFVSLFNPVFGFGQIL